MRAPRRGASRGRPPRRGRVRRHPPRVAESRYRRAEALFALRRFRECADDLALATNLSGDSPDPVLAKRAADCDAALAQLAVLDEMETEQVKEKEEEEAKAQNEEQAERDRQLAELTAAAEDRERDPAVKALFQRLEKTFERKRRVPRRDRTLSSASIC